MRLRLIKKQKSSDSRVTYSRAQLVAHYARREACKELLRIRNDLKKINTIDRDIVQRPINDFATAIQTVRRNLRNQTTTQYYLFGVKDKRYPMVKTEIYHSGPLSIAILEQVKADLKQKIKSARRGLKAARNLLSDYRFDVLYEKVGQTYRKPGMFLEFLKAKKSLCLSDYKQPDNKAFHVAIEIECFMPDTFLYSDLKQAFMDCGLEKNVTLKGDSSIRYPDDHWSQEIAVMCRYSEFTIVLKKVCDILARFEAKVNKSCGLHVHLDGRLKAVNLMASRLIAAQSLLFSVVPQSRRNNTFCKKTKDLSDNHNRYRAVNLESLRKHGTIEVRLHSGTVNYEKIRQWVNLLVIIAREPIETFVKMPRQVNTWCKALGLNSNQTKFWLERAKRFSDASIEDTLEAVAA